MIIHCVCYWLLALFEITIGCFKLALMVAVGLAFWPCLILYYRKFGRDLMDDRRRRSERRRNRRNNSRNQDEDTEDDAENNGRSGSR